VSAQTVWLVPQKPADLAESQLLSAILDGSFPIASALPPERELAQQLGVTRPTLREALQRLARDGWIQIQQGKSTIVKNYWVDGNLIMLNSLAKHSDLISPDFVTKLLEVRVALAPAYIRLAIENDPSRVINFLEDAQNLPDTALAYSQFDKDLHHYLCTLTENPIYTMIYNGFREISYQFGIGYFNPPKARRISQEYYQGLLQDAKNKDPKSAAERTAKVMQTSIDLWQESISKEEL
jgi:GntR family negative regulator for fad regulon and positive regulator of fabA